MIRLKVKYTSMPILPVANYKGFLEVLAKNDYAMCMLLGKVVQEREDAARTLIKAFEVQGHTVQFLKSIATQEINMCNDPNTLFRANSLASKAIDVYMKHIALPYLKSVLGPIVKTIVSSNKSCEVDPARVPAGEDIQTNWKNLIEYMESVCTAIFSTPYNLPPYVFACSCHDSP